MLFNILLSPNLPTLNFNIFNTFLNDRTVYMTAARNAAGSCIQTPYCMYLIVIIGCWWLMITDQW